MQVSPNKKMSATLYFMAFKTQCIWVCLYISLTFINPCLSQGCNKTFPSKEKLTKHLELHKQPKQFCCPHENCNRVFLRQSHLKNHLKIHTQDYFVCPVMGELT